MIDLETLGVIPTSIVLTVGVVIFDDNYDILDQKKYILDKKEQLLLKRTYCDSTITFWKNQPEEAKQQFKDSHIYSLNEFKKDFFDFVKKYDVKMVWSSAPVLDVGCLQTLYGDGDYLPWKYNQVRDLRTIRDYLRNYPEREGVHHDCVDDCIYQVICLKKSIKDMMLYGYQEISNQITNKKGI